MSGLTRGADGDARRGAARHAIPVRAARVAEAPRIVGGIVFDVPDVLYDATLWRRWLVQLIGRLGVRVSYAEFDRAWCCRLMDVHRGRREFDETLESLLIDLGLSWALIDEIEAAGRIQRRRLELEVRPWPGVVATVAELARRGVPLIAWADTWQAAPRLAERLQRMLPGSCFQAVMTSCDLEAALPDPRCYQALLEACALLPAETIYVGHDAAHLAGAQTAGLYTVAFNFEAAARADCFLTRFDDLLRLVELRNFVAYSCNPPSAGRRAG